MHRLNGYVDLDTGPAQKIARNLATFLPVMYLIR
jgi:hypothetical protein